MDWDWDIRWIIGVERGWIALLLLSDDDNDDDDGDE